MKKSLCVLNDRCKEITMKKVQRQRIVMGDPNVVQPEVPS
jgi:hypothetical protein